MTRVRSILVSLLATATALAFASTASAVNFTYSFEDANVFAEGGFAGFAGSTDVTGGFSVDVGAFDSDADPNDGRFENSITNFSLFLDGTQLLSQGDVSASIFAVNVAPSDPFSIVFAEIEFDTAALVLPFPLDVGQLFMAFAIEPEFDDDGVPTELGTTVKSSLKLSLGTKGGPTKTPTLQSKRSQLFADSRNGDLAVDNPIPEPTAAFLFMGGLLVAGHAVRRRRES